MTHDSERYAIQTMDDDMISLSEIGSILWLGKRWILGVTVVFLALAMLYLAMAQPVWRVNSLIKVDYNQSEFILALLGAGHVKLDKPQLAAEIEQLKAPDFIRGAFQGQEDLSQNINVFLKDYTVKEKGRETGIIEVSLTGKDAQQMARRLGRINDHFIKHGSHKLLATLDRAIAVANGRVVTSRTDLQEAEAALPESGMPQTASMSKQDASLLLQLEQNLVTAQSRYSDALHQQAILHQARELAEAGVYVLSKPEAEEKPVSPKYTLIFILALMLGVMVGVVTVFIREMLRNNVKTASELKNKTGLAVLAAIGSNDPEGIRELRTNLLYRLDEIVNNSGNNRVLICSPSTGEGKGYVAVNLARLLAAAGKKVLLIDADLRRGALYNDFAAQATSLVDILMAEATENRADTSVLSVEANLDLIAGNHYPENPSELLMGQGFRQLLGQFSKRYDVVLIHVPPVLEFTDAAIVGALCDIRLMIARADKTTVNELETASQRLQLAGIKVTGCVLNGVETAKA